MPFIPPLKLKTVQSGDVKKRQFNSESSEYEEENSSRDETSSSSSSSSSSSCSSASSSSEDTKLTVYIEETYVDFVIPGFSFDGELKPTEAYKKISDIIGIPSDLLNLSRGQRKGSILTYNLKLPSTSNLTMELIEEALEQNKRYKAHSERMEQSVMAFSERNKSLESVTKKQRIELEKIKERCMLLEQQNGKLKEEVRSLKEK